MEIIANIIIPIITFGLGIGINWRYNRKNKHRELSLYRELVIKYLDNIIPLIYQQKISIKDFIYQISISDKTEAEIFNFQELPISLIKNLPIEKLSEVFLINLCSKDRKELSSMFYLFTTSLIKIEENQKKLLSTYEIYKKEISILSQRLDENIPKIKFILNNFDHYDKTISWYETNILNSLKNIYKKIDFTDKTEIRNLHQNISTILLAFKKHRNDYHKFQEISANLCIAYNDLEISYDFYSKKAIKNWYSIK